MPDRRTQRGPNPRDRQSFGHEVLGPLRRATGELSWLLEMGYPPRASLKLVGDRHALRTRQRSALQRCAASATACLTRAESRVAPEQLVDTTLEIDGYNVLLTIEAALSGGVVLLARDGAVRDLAAMSAHYRRVDTTRPAIGLLADFLDGYRCRRVHWYLDRPVSNSGRLGSIIRAATTDCNAEWTVELADKVDARLKESPYIVASADSAILDRCGAWLNLARLVIDRSVPEAWLVDLSVD